MCGISGIVGKGTSEQLGRMVCAMQHRGPDDDGVWGEEGVQLGMARLSIQDLSMAGHQPMISDDGRYVIVFNGEIYNYHILKKEFLSGEQFKSNSDTEVLLKLYAKMGKDLLQHLRGMFAFTIWDKETKELFGARDRMGIKPFLYYKKDGLFVFASELKAILSSGWVKKEINKKGLADLFLYGAVQWPDTMITDVISLAPGNYFIYKNNKLTIVPYWEFPTTINTSISFEEAIEKFKSLYEESVKLRMISDRKVGIFLSSGIDSVSMLANLRSQNIDNIRTCTIGFEDKHKRFFSEIKKAKELSTHFGYENDAVLIGYEDVKKDFDKFIFALDQPSVDGLNTYFVSKASKDYLTVALSGLGGDELMMGYPRNLNAYNFLSRKSTTNIFGDSLLRNRLFHDKNTKFLNHINNLIGGSKNEKFQYLGHRFIISPHRVSKLLNNDYELTEPNLIKDFFKFDNGNSMSLSNKLSYYEIRSYMLSQLLRDMDTVSMSQSIEVRFPLIDHKIVELLFSLPSEFKFRKSNKVNHSTSSQSYETTGNKRILIEAYRSELPAGYLDQPKQGFQLPVYDWVAKALDSEIISILNEKESSEYFNRNAIQEKADQFMATKQLDTETFLIVVFLKWLKMINQL